MITSELYWVETPWLGRIAIMPRPRGGDWLEDEVSGWRNAGVHVVLSLLTPEEVEELDLMREGDLCRREGLEFLSFPIEDRQVPTSRNTVETLIESLARKLQEGKNVAIHCRQGVGRAGLVAASVLSLGGDSVDQVLQALTKARHCAVPETPEQRKWVEDFARSRPVAPGKV
jgi:protein-tyrosine phosphatase